MKTLVRLVLIGKDFSMQMTRKNISAFAASAAFFLFLSMVPLLMALCAILPYTSLTAENLIMACMKIVPETMGGFIQNVIYDVYERTAGTITVFAIVTVWSAAKAMLALIQGLNEVNDIEEKRNYLLLRTIACLYTVIMLVAILLSVFIMVFGNVIVDIALHDFPQLQVVVQFIMRFRFLFSWVILTLIFAMIYTFVPSVKLKFRKQLPGAAFSAVVWSIASYFFSVYVEYFNGFGTYGSLTTIVILMFWFYMVMYILLIGAHINRYFGPVYKFLFGWLDKSAKTH
ncbi:MAG: YihY/virulence factor BrkB family protein [Bacillus sp. (in: Bacteria)]|nr:YihY/virulence factor BrkB family protein [Bacillus sp. (in: firmicutes)]MCM1427669.1 YihY/virulence factor BrkB family protein [Eubacterium sp.]